MNQNQRENILKKKNILFMTIVMCLSIFFSILIFEIFLRISTENISQYYNEYLYDKELFLYDRELNALRYKVNFLEQYKDKVMWKSNSHDSYLGWDHNIQGGRIRKTGKDDFADYFSSDLKIITIGDSFTYGSEVGDKDTYSYYLEKQLAEENNVAVLNMGVGGYGIDQAILKYQEYAKLFNPNFLVFGIHTPNYERTSLPFFSYYKPYYVMTNGKVTLVKREIPAPDQGFLDVSREVDYFYVTSILRKVLTEIKWDLSDKDEKKDYFRETDTIIEYILVNLLKDLETTQTSVLIVHIPVGESFLNVDKLKIARYDKQYKNLIKIYDKLDIPYIDLLTILPEKYSLDYIFDSVYLYRTEEYRGHFSPEGNKVVASLIKEYFDKAIIKKTIAF